MRRTDDASDPNLDRMYADVRALALAYLRSRGDQGAVRGGLPATASGPKSPDGEEQQLDGQRLHGQQSQQRP